MTAFEDYLQAELPKRSALETNATVSYDGDPNDGGAPAALQNAPVGTWYFRQGTLQYYRKYSSAADSWALSDISLWSTTAEIDLYVSAVYGDDSNEGDISNPLETLIEAELRIPFNVNHTVRIHVAPHSGNGYAPPEIHNRNLQANIWIIGDGGGGVTDGFTEIVSSSVAQSGSTNLLLRTTGGLSSSEYYGMGVYFGRTIEILTGAAAGDRKTIRNNDTIDIYPTFHFLLQFLLEIHIE